MYKIEVHTAENGSVLRIINRITSEYILVGGFEGLQRYTSRNKIKWQKLDTLCLCSKYEVIPAVSSVLTQGMQDNLTASMYISTKRIESTIREVGISIGNLEFFKKYKKKSSYFSDIEMEEIENIAYCRVVLPTKKGSFDAEKAAGFGILEKKDIIELNKTGELVVNSRKYCVEEFRTNPVEYPVVLVLTILSEDYKIDKSSSNLLKTAIEEQKQLEIFIRAAPETFKNKKIEHKAVARVEERIKKLIPNYDKKSKNNSIEVYVVMNTEDESEKVTEFYDKVCPVYASIIRPLVYSPKHTKCFRNKKVLVNRSEIEYKNEHTVYSNLWAMPKRIDTSSNGAGHERKEKNRICENNSYCSTLNSPYIVFLGTAAAVPGVIRNVSSVLMSSEKGSILIDCGEDTHTQLSKIDREYAYNYNSINMILLTHRHADHMLGVYSVLARCLMSRNKTVLVFGNRCIVDALKHFGLSCIFIQNSKDLAVSVYEKDSTQYISVSTSNSLLHIAIYKTIYRDGSTLDPFNYKVSNKSKKCAVGVDTTSLNSSAVEFINLEVNYKEKIDLPTKLLYKVTMCSALHIHESYSIKIEEYTSNKPYSVVFSGDTMPNKEFAELGKKADVMIHEATFEDTEISNAKATHHSTISDALRIFRESEAGTLFFTHFSQRYKTVTIPEEARLAMDYMVYSPSAFKEPQDLLHATLLEWASQE